ncbi:MAG: exodeoxyribonuclease III [Alphaproteobacteria bacterium]|nr:exodeoxyribonuclease III [Alphaproteobacteria bacterium]
MQKFQGGGVAKIATWNVNSVRARLPNLLRWLGEAAPDVVLLQETKTVCDGFPRLEIESLGYHLATLGQKTYNGVAILSREPLADVVRALPGDPDDGQARYIEALVGGTLRVASIYLPNGNPTDGESFPYKLRFLDRLRRRAGELLRREEPLILGGDYNVCPTDDDVFAPGEWAGDALCRPESRRGFRAIVHLGFTDALRALHPEKGLYSFWDYQGGAWPRNHGLRIDHLLLSPQAADRLRDSGVDSAPRGWERPSDHAPVWCALADQVSPVPRTCATEGGR